MNQLVTTSDGSHTLFVPELNEHFHSVHGAVQESEFIFIRNGFDMCTCDPVRIFEVGFGTGLNALLTAFRAITGTREVFYTSIEKYPLGNRIAENLNHHLYAGKDGKQISERIHSSEWGKMINILPFFNLMKIEADLTKNNITGSFNLIYFDAFGPDKQPEMWTKNIMERIAEITESGGVFVTYSAKGEVRRNLTECGFKVILTEGPPGKRHIIRAIKI